MSIWAIARITILRLGEPRRPHARPSIAYKYQQLQNGAVLPFLGPRFASRG